MIPVNFLRKMCVCNLNLNGVTIPAKVVDNEELVNDGIRELRNKLDPNFPVVGFDLKYTLGALKIYNVSPKSLLVLCVKDRCLLVQLGRIRVFPDSLLSFLKDQGLCFLGLEVSRKLQSLKQDWVCAGDPSFLKTGVDIGTFAARALNNRELERCTNLVELASKAGLPVPKQSSLTTASQCPDPDWGALCFSPEELKYAIKDAYECYRIGTKLMSAS